MQDLLECHHSGHWMLISHLEVCLSSFRFGIKWKIYITKRKTFTLSPPDKTTSLNRNCATNYEFFSSLHVLFSSPQSAAPDPPTPTCTPPRPPPPTPPSNTSAATKKARWFIKVNTRHVVALITAKPLISRRNSCLPFFFSSSWNGNRSRNFN